MENMETIDDRLLERLDTYVETLFAAQDEGLLDSLKAAESAGLPGINVSPSQGKLMYLLAKIAGARRILEIGTLGGYSTTWLARALPANGKVITLEISARNAEVARANFERAGVADRVEIRVGAGADSLKKMIAAREEAFDLVFIDADKPGYIEYLSLTLELSHPGTLILADNLLRNGLVLEDKPSDENARGAKAFNEAIAADPRLESIVLPIYREKVDGLSISLVK
jgi:predicted O-methyltransferase YrrM